MKRIICCCKKKKKLSNGHLCLCKYEQQVNNKHKKIKIRLETTSLQMVKILIDPNKTVTELIKFYFKIIRRQELFGDQSIRFLFNAQLLFHDSKKI